MTYNDIKLLFRKASGRFDLISAAGEDTGGGVFLKAGQDFLDRRIPRKWNFDVIPILTSVGQWVVEIPDCLAVKAVWSVIENSKTDLKLMRSWELIKLYPNPTLISTWGAPAYFSPTVRRPAGFGTFTTVIVASNILIGPPCDIEYNLEVEGQFKTPYLIDEPETNYYTMAFPMLLVYAACYRLELLYRNMEGAKGWLDAIEVDLRDMDYDEVEEDNRPSAQMEG